MSNEKEAIKLLKEEIFFIEDCPSNCKYIDVPAHRAGLVQLLALLQAKPEAGEWTKSAREEVCGNQNRESVIVNEACDRLDQAKAEKDEFQKRLTFIQQGHNPYEQIKELETEKDKLTEEHIKLNDTAIQRIRGLEAENKQLKEAIKS